MTVGLLAITAVAVSMSAEGSTAGTGQHAALERLADLSDKIPGDSVVALVDGERVIRGQVANMVAFSQTAGGEFSTAETALNELIDDRLLTQAAKAYGVIVTDAEVDQMVASALEPYQSGELKGEDAELFESMLRSLGVSPESAATNEDYRAAMRDYLYRARYVQTVGGADERSELAAHLRIEAEIQLFPENLPTELEGP